MGEIFCQLYLSLPSLPVLQPKIHCFILQKPHKCPHCEFASAYRGHVKDHIRASHEAVKYPCPYPNCNHQSSYKGNLDKHIRNIHTKNSVT